MPASRLDPSWMTYLNPGAVNGGTDDQSAQGSYLDRYGGFDWEGARRLGYTGAMPVDGPSTDGGGAQQQGNPEQELLAWMQATGNTYGVQPYGATGQLNAWFDPQGSEIAGTRRDFQPYNDNTFWTGALLAGGLVGSAAAGAFSGGAGGAAATTGGGLTSADLAAIYGNAGYGAGATAGELAAGAAGGAGGLASTAAAPGGFGTLGTIAPGAGASAALPSMGAAGAGAISAPTAASLGIGSPAAVAGNGALIRSGLQTGASLLSTYMQGQAAQRASEAQQGAATAGQNQLQQSLQQVRADLQPYTQAGTQALGGQQALLGLQGSQAQQAAIDAIRSSPAFTSQQQLGENRILANASATGGLRGGNVQGALAQFSPALLSSLIDQQYNRLGGLASMGQNSAAGVGTATMNAGNNIANLMQQGGAAAAGGQLARGATNGGYLNSIVSGLGLYAGLTGGF